MAISVNDLAERISGRVEGDGSRLISGLSGLEQAGPGDVSFLANGRYAALLESTKAAAVVISNKYDGPCPPSAALIRVANADAAFAQAAEIFSPPSPDDPAGCHSSAIIDATADVSPDASVQAGVIIERDATVGAGSVLRPGCYVGRGARIGRDCLIHANVTIREHCTIGDRVIIHSGSVIGSDGFGYSFATGKPLKIPQIGRVIIEDDVEIGANVTIDRARFDATVIGRNVKIDNLVQIAHNVRIGENSIIVALCAIAGSTTLGRGCMLGGQVAVDGHLRIGNNVRIAAKSGVTKDIADNSVIGGFPAHSQQDDLRMRAEMRKLIGASRRLDRLERRLAEIAQHLAGD